MIQTLLGAAAIRETQTRPNVAVRSLSSLGRALIEPSPLVLDKEVRRTTSLLAALALVHALTLVGIAVGARETFSGAFGARIVSTLVGAAVIQGVAYGLCRSRYVRVGTFVSVALLLALPIAITALGAREPNFEGFETSAWLVTSLLIASAILSTRASLAFAVIAICTVALGAALGAPENRGEFLRGGGFLCASAALILTFSHHRSRLERDRSAELRARNAELEALRDSLEERVQTRTAELSAANGDLAGAIDALKRNQETLLITEKMASLGRLTAGIAHEMNSPLCAVRLSLKEASALSAEYANSIGDASVEPEDHRAIAKELAAAIAVSDAATERVCSFVRSIRAQTRGGSATVRVLFDASTAVNDALTLLAHAAVDNRCKIQWSRPEIPISLMGDPGRFAQVVTNLVSNAIDACSEVGGGLVRVALSPGEVGGALLEVRDNGPGILKEHFARIFDPMFTTKAVGKGTGLGLTIVHEIVRGEFDGTVSARNHPEGGAIFAAALSPNMN